MTNQDLKTKDRRRNFITRNQYNILENCLYKCKGKEQGCSLYINYKDTCLWYNVCLKDKIKLQEGKDNLTFPLLETIINKYKKNE